jgi:hypothetical protein
VEDLFEFKECEQMFHHVFESLISAAAPSTIILLLRDILNASLDERLSDLSHVKECFFALYLQKDFSLTPLLIDDMSLDPV